MAKPIMWFNIFRNRGDGDDSTISESVKEFVDVELHDFGFHIVSRSNFDGSSHKFQQSFTNKAAASLKLIFTQQPWQPTTPEATTMHSLHQHAIPTGTTHLPLLKLLRT